MITSVAGVYCTDDFFRACTSVVTAISYVDDALFTGIVRFISKEQFRQVCGLISITCFSHDIVVVIFQTLHSIVEDLYVYVASVPTSMWSLKMRRQATRANCHKQHL